MQTGFNWRDFKIAVAMAYGYSQERMSGFVGVTGRAIRKRLDANGDWIRQVTDILKVFAEKNRADIEQVVTADLKKKFEKFAGKAIRNIDEGLDDPLDATRRDNNSWKVIEQLSPKKTVVEHEGKVIHGHVPLPIDAATHEGLGRLLGKQVAFLEEARQLPGGEDDGPVIDLVASSE